ncbi:serine O-acetyltransferase [Vibrio alginolyticus]
MNCIIFYRVSHFFFEKKIPFLPWFITKLGYLIFNSHIPASTEIGSKSKCAYGGIGVVVHGKAKIGSRVIIGQGVTIGRQLSPVGVPHIGNDVYISAGSRILGDIKIGNNVIIGANSVVIRDVPDNCIVAGVPAKVVRYIDVPVYEMLENVF